MAYSKQTWDTTSYVNPTRMNHIEDGIKAVSDDSGKTNQLSNNENKSFRVLISKTNNDTDELNPVNKAQSLLFNPSTASLTLERKHTSTSATSSYLNIGNAIPVDTEGNSYGVLRIYGRGQYSVSFTDSNNVLTNDRVLRFPDKTGVLALVGNEVQSTHTQLLHETNIPSTATSYDCDWKSYKEISITLGSSYNVENQMIITSSWFNGTTSTIRVILYKPNSETSYEIYKNTDNKVYIKGNNPNSGDRIRIYGITYTII